MIQFDLNEGDITASLNRFLRLVERDLETVLDRMSLLLLREVQLGWPVDSGVSRAAWTLGHARQLIREIVNTSAYARVIEFGGYPGVGPKTVQRGAEQLPGEISIGAGIFPSQRPSAPLRRALAKIQPELDRQVADVIRRAWRQAG